MTTYRALALCATAAVAITLAACHQSSDPDEKDAEDAAATADLSRANVTVQSILAANSPVHEEASDYTWDVSSEVSIVCNGTSISASGPGGSAAGVTVNGPVATITAAGNYRLTGTLTNGQIVVSAPSSAVVRLILGGVTLSNTAFSPLQILTAKKAVIILADQTNNRLTDGASYVFPNAGDTEPNAALYSKSDLSISGSGSLSVAGNFNDGIASKDGLIIKSGLIAVTAADDGIRGKDYLVIRGGTVTVTSGGDGLKSDNEEDVTRGYICVESGEIAVTAGGDGLTAATDAVVAGGTFTLTSGGGSGHVVSGTTSAKGIKGTVNVVIADGTFVVNSADDAIHSNAAVVIHGGSFALSTADDGIHADTILAINAGTILITKSYEGIESTALVINDGDISITSSDDGINGAGGNDGSGAGGFPGGMPPAGNRVLQINGGRIAVNATGDGVDVNGSISMTGGTLLVHGPTSNANGPLDYDRTFTMTGGLLVAAGSSGMAQAPGSTSSQYAVLMVFGSARAASTLFHVQASDGTDIVTFKPVRSYQSVAFSSPLLVKGKSYDVYVGGSSTGPAQDGLYTGGVYSGGTKVATFTVSATVTRVNG